MKHNHDSWFHGRTYTTYDWCGIDKDDPLAVSFKANTDRINKELKLKIPCGVEFSDGQILPEYQNYWSNFVSSIYGEMASLINAIGHDEYKVGQLYKKILGAGSNSYRVIKKSNSSNILVQDLRQMNNPKSVVATVQQKIPSNVSHYECYYIWYLTLGFSNGLRMEARSKQGKRTLFENRLPPLKPDWKAPKMGLSGIKEMLYE